MNTLELMLSGAQVGAFHWPIKPSGKPLLRKTPVAGVTWPDCTQWFPKLNPACSTDNTTLGDCAITNSCRRFEKDRKSVV